MGVNLTRKILAAHVTGGMPAPGAELAIRIDQTLTQDATGITISSDGKISYAQPGNTQLQQAGQLQVAIFQNPAGLLKLGENLYVDTISSGNAIQSNPGVQGAGTLRQGFLELSNVEPVRELIDLITTQRSFEMNSQVIEAGNNILQTITNLARR